jgi:hypothetical protein
MEQAPVVGPDGEPTFPWMVFYDPHRFLIWGTDRLAARIYVEGFGHHCPCSGEQPAYAITGPTGS